MMATAERRRVVVKGGGSRYHEDQMDHVERELLNWAAWMRNSGERRGAGGASTGFIGGGYTANFDDMVAAMERKTAEITDTVIADLPAVQQAAIHHAYLNAVFRFGPQDAPASYKQAIFERHLVAAKEAVRRGLKARHVWIGD